jgi:sugar phosphate isomerase/epimerase
MAAEYGLSWVELPPGLIGAEPADWHRLRHLAEEHGVRFVFSASKVDAAELRRCLGIAAELGAPTVRCILSSVLCGDRRGLPGGWRAHVDACTEALESVLPDAERLRIAVAVENHQDADSEDLLRLCRRFESRYFGVTLDCGNPLAVMEDPLEFAERLAPYLRHAHLKDYRIYPAENGYRLVRCALGEGVVPFPELFTLFDAQEWPVTRNIEMAALHARQIPMLERTWWDEFSSRDARETLSAMSLIWRNLRPAEEDWRTPLERDAPGEELLAYELEQLEQSVTNLRGLIARQPCSS